MSILVAIYKLALKMLPSAYREQYAEPMVQTLEDMIADQHTQIAKWNVWLRTMIDVPITTARQYAQVGGANMKQAPNYAKQGMLLSALLLTPFVAAIIANSMHPLTDVWSSVGYVCIFILPVIALAIGLAVLGRLLLAHDLWSRVKDTRQLQANWILFAVPVLAFGMVLFAFGHDRVQCITKENMSKIVRCVRNS